MENKDILLLILVVVVVYLVFCNNNNEEFKKNTIKKIDNFTNSDSITITESIKNLGLLAQELQNANGDLTLPVNLNVGAEPLANSSDATGHVKFLNKNTAWMDILPKHMIVMWFSNDCPKGWAPCDGNTYRLNSNGDAIRSTRPSFNQADQQTEITTPNFHGRMPMGSAGINCHGLVPPSQGNSHHADGGNNAGWPNNFRFNISHNGGARRHTLSVGEMPRHNHALGHTNPTSLVRHHHDNCTQSGPAFDCGDGPVKSTISLNHTHHVHHTGSSHSHNNMPPFQVVHFIIKL